MDLRVEAAVVDGLLVVHKVGVKVQRQHLHALQAVFSLIGRKIGLLMKKYREHNYN